MCESISYKVLQLIKWSAMGILCIHLQYQNSTGSTWDPNLKQKTTPDKYDFLQKGPASLNVKVLHGMSQRENGSILGPEILEPQPRFLDGSIMIMR